MYKENTISLGTLRVLVILLSFPLLLTLLFSFFFTAHIIKPLYFCLGLFQCLSFFLSFFNTWSHGMFCAAFICIVVLLGNYVKDEPPEENTLWMAQRDTGINRNLAKVKFKLRL